jgi:hypothetical protein
MSEATLETSTDFISISAFADAFSSQGYIRPRLHCASGFTLGVVADKYAFSTPRAVNARKYSHVEVVRPSEVCESLTQYAQDPQTPCETSYAFVPVKEVEALIAIHGGIDWAETLAGAHANAVPFLNKLKGN